MSLLAPTISTFRDGLIKIVPRWLKAYGGNAIKLVYTFALHLDALGEALDFGIRARFPGQQADALSLIGRQRGLLAGPNEPADSYATRLQFWRQTRKRKGNWFALLEQLQAYFAPAGFSVALLQDRAALGGPGYRYDLLPGAYMYASDYSAAPPDSVSMSLQPGWNWDGGANPNRFWVLIYVALANWPSGAAYGNDGVWSDPGTVGDGGVIGSTASPVDVGAVKAILTDWTPPHATPMQAILAFSESDWLTLPFTTGVNAKSGDRSPNYNYWNLQ